MEEEKQTKLSWQTLRNPFRNLDTSEVITGHVSGRITDIIQLLTGGQSAIILSGAPSIGKSALIRYLQRSPQEWSWRDELVSWRNQLRLDDIRFVQIDLTNLTSIVDINELLKSFIGQCKVALHSVWQDGKTYSSDLKGLRDLLRDISQESPHSRYFLIIDTIERLGRFSVQHGPDERTQTPQEYGLALLDRCGAIRTLVDLIDEFVAFGVILSIQSLPRSKSSDRLTHVSADLARFTTITLQTFTWEDTSKFLAQTPDNFGTNWADEFEELGGRCIFSREEQTWLHEQAGTHPYLLHQFCIQTFDLKQEYASNHGTWTELQDRDKRQLADRINERLNTFFAHTWDRLQEAINKSSKETMEETRSKFYNFIKLLPHQQATDIIDSEFWDQLGTELRFILYSEGVLRYDLPRPIHFPGAILRQYLVQKAKESDEIYISPPSVTASERGFRASIIIPGKQREELLLSDLEYRLLKTLVQNSQRCSEIELMIGAWGKKIEKSTFTQRMHHLRRKLREQTGTEIIENRYGGIYSLNHTEWLKLD